MGSIFNQDFIDFVTCLNKSKVKYVLVGGYSVIIHGYSRTTGDLDLWVEPTTANYTQLVQAFRQFQMPIMGMTLDKFLDTDNYDVFQYGRSPVSIDIMTKVKGLEFQNTYRLATIYNVNENLKIKLIHINHLLEAKKASGRYKDLEDVKQLLCLKTRKEEE